MVSYDMIADRFNIKKKLDPNVTELFIRLRKLNFCFTFITLSYFAMPKILN